MLCKSGKISILIFAIPAVLGCLIWGYGGEDLLLASGSLMVLSIACAFSFVNAGTGVTCASFRAGRVWLIPLTALLFLSTLSVAYSVNVFVALKGALTLLVLAVAGYQVSRMSRDAKALLLVLCVTVIAGFSIYGFCQLAGVFSSSFWHNDQYASRFVNSSHFGACLSVAVPLSVGLAVTTESRTLRGVALMVLATNLVSLLLTRSRAVWMVCFVLYPVLGILLLSAESRTSQFRMRSLLAVLLVGGAVGFVSLLFLGEGILARWADLFSTRGQGLVQRVQIWRVTLAMIKDNPFGLGTGCFGEEYLRYKILQSRAAPLRAHNEILQMVAEWGWVALPLLFCLAISAAREAIRSLKRDGDPLRACICVAVLAYLLLSLADFPLRLLANGLFCSVLIGCFVDWPNEHATSPQFVPMARSAKILVLALCLIVCSWWGSLTMASWYKEKGCQLMNQADFSAAEPMFVRSERFMPLDPDVAFCLGWIYQVQSNSLLLDDRRHLLNKALKQFDKATAIASSRPMQYLRRAWVLRDLGDEAGADTAFRTAIKCDPTLGRYSAFYGDFLLRQGRYEEAALSYRGAQEKFHDGGDVNLTAFLERIWRATGREDLLESMTPSNRESRRILENFRRRHKLMD